MDRLTHMSITNCVKELDSLEKLILSGEFTLEEISDWIKEVSWNLSGVLMRRRYDSDEFQHRLKVWINKRKQISEKKDED